MFVKSFDRTDKVASGPGGLFKAVEVSTLGATKQSSLSFKLLDWDFSWLESFMSRSKISVVCLGKTDQWSTYQSISIWHWVPVEVMKENETKRQHWGESVKGRVSSDYKAFWSGWNSGSMQVLRTNRLWVFTVCFCLLCFWPLIVFL